MKTLYKLLGLCLLPLMMWSCEKDGEKVVATAGTAASLKASASTLVLTKADQSKDAVTFDWAAADFGYSAAQTQVLQMDVKGNNFANPKNVNLLAGATSQKYSVVDFNALVLTMGIPFQKSTDIEVRVKSSISTALAPVYSNVLSLAVTPFELVSWIYVPGDYQGWDPSKADSLKSATGNGVYTGTIYYPDRAGANFEFKVTTKKDWTNAFGDAGNGTISTSGANFKAPGAGSYQLEFDLNNNTWKMTKNSWGVIGDATANGWDSDQDLIYDNGSGLWVATLVMKDGEFKFRYNDDWGLNYGADGTANGLKAGGDNIKITAGRYKISFNLEAKTYSLTKL